MSDTKNRKQMNLPGLNCGACGSKSCAQFAEYLSTHPNEANRCIKLAQSPQPLAQSKSVCTSSGIFVREETQCSDALGRDYDFVLDIFPSEPGPRETIIPHNPQLTRELDIKKGDVLIGRPLGMSCGCPITHCGVVIDADQKTGVIVWHVTGPLRARSEGCKDLGYYSAQAYEGIVLETSKELAIGKRYWFLPRRCMLQWRHSGLVNFIRKNNDGSSEIRIEGLMIG